jgi:hypothetical protein
MQRGTPPSDWWMLKRSAKVLLARMLPGKIVEIYRSLNELMDSSDQATINSFRNEHRLTTKFCVALYFKTSMELLEPVGRSLGEHYSRDPSVFFLVCGMVPESLSSLLAKGKAPHARLDSSYSQGINTRSLLGILAASDFFIGRRGGFDVFPRLCGVLSLNVWDLQGRQEDPHLWLRELWEGNPIAGPIYADETSVAELTATAISLIDRLKMAKEPVASS